MKAVLIPFLEGTFVIISDVFYDLYFNSGNRADGFKKHGKYKFDKTVDRMYYKTNCYRKDLTPGDIMFYIEYGSVSCSNFEELEDLNLEEINCYLLLNNYVDVTNDVYSDLL